MCECITQTNEALEKQGLNTMINTPIMWNKKGIVETPRVLIETVKRDPSKREKPINLLAAYCPFCGQPYEQPEAPQVPADQPAEANPEPDPRGYPDG